MNAEPTEPTRRLRLRYAAVCADCGTRLEPGTDATWNRETKRATCVECVAPEPEPEPTKDIAGASAAAEGERRAAALVDRVRSQHGERAAAVALLMANRDAAATWGKGSAGESQLAAYLQRKLGERVIGLHDRLIPGTKGNIDHIYVAPTGVWVVDAKALAGRVQKRELGPIWRREHELRVRGRDRTALAAGVEKQVACVIAALELEFGSERPGVYSVLCFVGADWGTDPFDVRKVWVTEPNALRKALKKKGSVSRETMERAAAAIDLALPPAT